ncbi:MAG: prepilin-type N-terminal cleavage/methylation domain-containing protein [Planctomycetes bacterium]|nr:prepilin-type N-terminal cleavage/methylation domain-containing protein [Planctomycetota bacterium]
MITGKKYGCQREVIKGFTLLEVIIALLVLAIGLSSIFSLLGRGTHSLYQGVTDLTLTSYATTIFSEISAKLKAIGDTPQSLYDQKHPSFPPNYSYDLEFVSLEPVSPAVRDAGKNSILVVLTIKWMRGRYSHSEKFQAIMLR